MKNKIFEANPNLDCYFETSDGSAFFTENAAESHAQTLKDKKVKPVYKATESKADAKAKDDEETKAKADTESKAKTDTTSTE